ncbi:MAG: DUF4143 domain-containing protein [Micrococcales bacterium]|nr:DUF4143 domain-containing protein [Micrococcales bacterium]
MTPPYLPRVADGELSERLGRIGAVLIEGMRGCGKTETARRQAASEVLLDVDDTAKNTASIAPFNVLGGPTPRLIDEWQMVPGVWNAVRRAVDDRRADGQFILTGSASPADDATRHTGVGRFSRLRMRTLSLAESGLSSAVVSLGAVLDGGDLGAGAAPTSLNDLIDEVCHGGWPGDRHRPLDDARRNVADVVNEVARVEIRQLDGVRRDPARVLEVMRALARNTGTDARDTTLAADVSRGQVTVSDETVAAYARALERIMVLEPLEAWVPIMRSKARLRSRRRHHFADPALAAALLDADPAMLRADLKTFGFLFESLVLRDLRVYSGPQHASVGYYRDSTGLEVDAIVHGGGGRWAAFEIKLGGAAHVIDAAARNLLTFAAKVDRETVGSPQLLGIITAEGYAYTRPDGVAVIPLGCLGP